MRIATAQVVIAEVGIDMTRFPTSDHLAWARSRQGSAIQQAGRRAAAVPGTGTDQRTPFAVVVTSPGPSARPPLAAGSPNVPWSAVLANRPPAREEESNRRRRKVDPDDRVGVAQRRGTRSGCGSPAGRRTVGGCRYRWDRRSSPVHWSPFGCDRPGSWGWPRHRRCSILACNARRRQGQCR